MAMDPTPSIPAARTSLRQVVVGTRDLDDAVAQLCEAFDLAVAYRDPSVATFGLVNEVMPVGDTFLEVVSPVRPDTPAARFIGPAGNGYMVIIQVDDLTPVRDRLRAAKLRIMWETHTPTFQSIHVHPGDFGTLASFDSAIGPWPAAGQAPGWSETGVGPVGPR